MNRKEPVILIQKDDFKSKYWAKAAEKNKLGKLIPIARSPMRMPFVLLKSILQREKPDAIIFRYLNDYPVFVKTVLRTITDLSTVIIARLFSVRIFWLAHNVDKETTSFYPLLIRLRRKFLIKNSKYVFVTDEMLVEYALRFLKIHKDKLKPLSFGKIDNEKYDKLNNDVIYIKQWLNEVDKENKKFKIGFWIGTPGNKKLVGLKMISKFCEFKKYNDFGFKFIVAGPIGNWLKKIDSKTYQYLCESENVLFINKYVKIPVAEWRNIFDFIWNPLDDYSIAFTVYNSVLGQIPIVALRNTFLGDFIVKNKVGFAVDKSSDFSEQLYYYLSQNKALEYNTFLTKRNWEFGAKVIFECIK